VYTFLAKNAKTAKLSSLKVVKSWKSKLNVLFYFTLSQFLLWFWKR